MKSPLDISVSCFENYMTSDNPQPVNLIQWLKSAKYSATVESIRKIQGKEERDNLKATLPAITPSGLFSYRSKDHLVQHSGLIQFDIDGKDHKHVANFAELKQQIARIVNVAYVGLSVSGRGYWGLVPIKFPDKHKSHFRAMKKVFAQFGLLLDNKPSNVASLRGYSYDPCGYFNHFAKVFESLDEPVKSPARSYHVENDSGTQVEELISQIQTSRTDITDGYDNWLRIGFAFADEFGETGRSYFHAVSQYHPGYDERETDWQYKHCLQSGGRGITIATFFHLCKEHGITLKKAKGNTLTKKDRALEAKFENPINDRSQNLRNNANSPQKSAKHDSIRPDQGISEEEYLTVLDKDPILQEINRIFEPELITW